MIGPAPPRFMSTNSHVSSTADEPTARRADANAVWKCATLRCDVARSVAARAADARSGLNPLGGPGSFTFADDSILTFFSSSALVGASANLGPSLDGAAGEKSPLLSTSLSRTNAALLFLRFAEGLMHSNAARSMAAKCPTGVLDRDRLLLRRSFASPGVPTSPSEVPSGVPTRTPAAASPSPSPSRGRAT